MTRPSIIWRPNGMTLLRRSSNIQQSIIRQRSTHTETTVIKPSSTPRLQEEEENIYSLWHLYSWNSSWAWSLTDPRFDEYQNTCPPIPMMTSWICICIFQRWPHACQGPRVLLPYLLHWNRMYPQTECQKSPPSSSSFSWVLCYIIEKGDWSVRKD